MKRKRALRRWFYVGGMTPADSGGVEAGGRNRVQEVQHTRHSSDLDKFRSSFLPKKTLAFLQSVVSRKEAPS